MNHQKTLQQSLSNEFLTPNSFCAIAADEKSSEIVWFLQIKSIEVTNANMVDDYRHTITAGMEYLVGSYLKKCNETKKGPLFKIMGKDVFFFRETIVYPFVNFQEQKGNYLIANHDTAILYCI